MTSNSREYGSMKWAALALALLLGVGVAACSRGVAAIQTVEAGKTWTVDRTTQLSRLTIDEGARLAAPAGHSLTLTVDGVERGIAPGTYEGEIALTVSEENPVRFGAMGGPELIHPFRHALYLDGSGVVASKSVPTAAGKYVLADGVLTGVNITSQGENFNGIYAASGTYLVRDARIDFDGNGGNDFAGFGAAVMSTGRDTTLVLDGAEIRSRGAIRTTAVADGGSRLIVKNSQLEAWNGELPADYRSNVSPGAMKDVPWMLGLVGNNRATNLLGDGTSATYINSSIVAEGWGALSIDNGRKTRLTAINSNLRIAGKSGYGSYAIGDSVNAFYGTSFDVPDYGVIITDGTAIFAASRPETLERLNRELQLGLTSEELRALAPKPTTVKSGRFGVMWHGAGNVQVADDTVFETGQTVFLVKGATADISVDGAGGARLAPGNGVLVQVMDNDDPGPVMTDGLMLNTGVYREPTTPAVKAKDFDVTATTGSVVTTTLANITVAGDLYNASRGGVSGGPPGFGPPGGPGGAPGAGDPPGAGSPNGPGGPPGARGPAPGRNLVLKLVNSQLTGVVSASNARHAKDTITAVDYRLLGEVTNTPGPAINNGVIVSLERSKWIVAGPSYLTALSLDGQSAVSAPAGKKLTMTVDGAPVRIRAGRYVGRIVLTPQ